MNAPQIALVTGSSRGLGRDMALQLARAGRDVVVTYRSRAEEGAAVVRDIEAMGRKAVALQLDTGDAAGFTDFAQRLDAALEQHWRRKRIDHLVNNAGVDETAAFGHTTEAQFDHLVDVHFKGVFFLTQQLLPQLADGGSVVLVSTGLTRFVVPGYAAYASMKGAVEVLAKFLAKELGPRRIRCNVVAPGAVETDFTRPAFDAHEGMREFLASQTALGRVGQPDDIGGVVAFLCSDAARWVNAQRVEASGGMFL